ncbi:cytosine-specific methyltransferase [Ascosphaera apis ARSEF 7405]|uniref:DNA (cytosine-5-)-methyltransferase n=1 Tax=Ascosphaera apis ARSEF 7405 TaxID=392613 RepID=A0A168C9R6_9EURO|nr:cytosine-specific methyltransferase [Ascosphaera apis ARSEF 7405]
MPRGFNTPSAISSDDLQLDVAELEFELEQAGAVQTEDSPETEVHEVSDQFFKEELAPAKGQRLSHVSPPLAFFPPSAYGVRPQNRTEERRLISFLKLEHPEVFDEGEIELNNFVVYAAPRDNRDGIVSLDQVAIKVGKSTFCFDGQIQVGDETHYLEGVPFSLVSVGGYEDLEQHTVHDSLWIQSSSNEHSGNGLWYRLKQPAKDYRHHFELFMWVANLAKHLLDFLSAHENVTLEHFKSDFVSWLKDVHGTDEGFMAWLAKYPSPDFRHAIVAHADFLQKQALDMDRQGDALACYENHLLWHEINPSLTPNLVMEKQPQTAKGTIVTPYVKRCFKEMEWGRFLNASEPRPEIAPLHKARCEAMGFNAVFGGKKPQFKSNFEGNSHGVQVGDVVLVPRDEQTKWKDGGMPWIAVVQDIKPLKHDTRLFVIWLYRATETICLNLRYPDERELFLSDHCNCDDSSLYASEVIGKLDVTWFASAPADKNGFFVRQTYSSNDASFTTLKDHQFVCTCRSGHDEEHQYNPSDTVLVETINTEEEWRLEPAEILAVDGPHIHIRPLVFRSFYDKHCRPNELLYTYETRSIMSEQIDRICHIRILPPLETSVPVPYDRNGTGDFFYIREALRDGCIVPLDLKPTFRQGFTLDQPRSKLRALNIFCGGGTFDRGLEEGGCIQSEWAVEWDVSAMLTYRANHRGSLPVKMFCGSVNDYLERAKNGDTGDLIARLGEVDFISAGSPCQGYSTANNNKKSDESLRNCSMIASVVSYVDFYRPKYAILENVIAMSNSTHTRNPLSQLVCAFVGMGYQTRVLKLDAWSFGAPQSRSRLFVMIAAPGLELPVRPANSHSHPEKTGLRALGRGASGVPYGERHWDTPVFNFVSAAKATRDLPSIDRGRITQIDWPDHRPGRIESYKYQEIINSIPKYPREQGLVHAVKKGRLRAGHHAVDANKLRKNANRSWTRINPDGLIPTVTTSLNPLCRFTGKWVHWEQDRLMTVQEIRRAQGYPDDEVLIGDIVRQWKIVGNSVARQVALVLGLKIREACEQDEIRGIDPTQPVKAPLAPDLGPLPRKRPLTSATPNRPSNFSIVIKTPKSAEQVTPTPVKPPSHMFGSSSTSRKMREEKDEPYSDSLSNLAQLGQLELSSHRGKSVTPPNLISLTSTPNDTSADEDSDTIRSVTHRKRPTDDQEQDMVGQNTLGVTKEKENRPYIPKRIKLLEDEP